MVNKSHTFKNNLQFVSSPLVNQITSINIFINVGSINEPKNLNGISHFIEHMIFKGTKKLKDSKSISTIFDSIGASINAHTTLDYTCYEVKCHSSYTKLCLHTLFDMILCSTFDKNETEREKDVVIEEITMHADNSVRRVNELVYQSLFNESSLAQSVGGSPKLIKKWKYRDIIAYYKHFYRPENIVISMASNIPFKKLLKMISSQKISKLNTKKVIKDFHPRFTINTKENRIILKNRKLDQVHMALGFRCCGRYNKDFYPLKLLEIILASNMSSLLFVNLREKNGLTYSVHIDLSVFEKIGNFIILTSVDKTKLFNKDKKKGAFDVIIETLMDLYRNGVSAEQLKLAKGFLKGMITLSLENSDTISSTNGVAYISNGLDKDIPVTQIYAHRYRNLTRASVNKVIRKYILEKNVGCAFIGDNITKSKSIISKKLSKFK